MPDIFIEGSPLAGVLFEGGVPELVWNIGRIWVIGFIITYFAEAVVFDEFEFEERESDPETPYEVLKEETVYFLRGVFWFYYLPKRVIEIRRDSDASYS